jgi:hypothetical protein
MNIEQRIEELAKEHAAILAHRQKLAAEIQQDDVNLHRLGGAISALSGLLAEGEPDEVSPNGTAAAELEPVETP